MPSKIVTRPNASSLITLSKQQARCHASRYVSSGTRPTTTLNIGGTCQQPISLSIRTRPFHHTTRSRTELQSTINTQISEEIIPPSLLKTSAQPQPSSPAPTTTNQTISLTHSSVATKPLQPLVLSKSVQALLPVLAAQKPHYITTHIHSFPYLLTEGDTLRLPFHLHGVSPGDVLRFNRASILGSRDYTLKAAALPSQVAQHAAPDVGTRKMGDVKHIRGEPFVNRKRTGEPSYIDERLYECRVRVMSLDSGPMVVTEKKKRRNRRLKRVMSKHKYTVVKVMEMKVKSLDELLEQEKGQVVME